MKGMILNEARTEGERLRLLLPSMLADLNAGKQEKQRVLSPSLIVTLIVLCFLAAAVVGAFILLKR